MEQVQKQADPIASDSEDDGISGIEVACTQKLADPMKLDFEEVDFPKNLSSSSLLNGAKLRQSMDCPVDTLIIRGVDFVSPMAFKLHLTPNILTTISVAFKVLALFNLYSGSRGTRWYFVLFAILAYVFDCFDGHYARKYSQCSVFGDYYDHISDWSYFLLLFLCTFIRGVESAALTVFLGTICLALAISAAFHMACQEAVYSIANPGSCEGPSLKFLMSVANRLGDPHKLIRWTRFGGVGVFVASTIMFALLAIK